MNQIKSRHWLLAASLAAIGIVPVVGVQPTLAQDCTGAELLQNCPSQNEQNNFSSGSGQVNMLDLIHKAQIGALGDMQQFTAEQQQNINSEADNFRAEQLRRLQQGSQATPNQPAVNPTSEN